MHEIDHVLINPFKMVTDVISSLILSFVYIVPIQCWNNCAPRSAVASVVEHQNVDIDKDASDMFELKVRSMVRDKSLTMADIAWYTDDPAQHQCLVTWEIFSSGIIGNLLTDTHEAELSLWPDSKYHIQVTCKNKVNINSFVPLIYPMR